MVSTSKRSPKEKVNSCLEMEANLTQSMTFIHPKTMLCSIKLRTYKFQSEGLRF